MQTLQFKTNINCDGCIAKITPDLNRAKGIKSWTVDIVNPDKVLTVETEQLTAKQVIESVKRAGFKAEKV
jgi:copper chaperone